MSHGIHTVARIMGTLLIASTALAQQEAPAAKEGLVKSIASKLDISDKQAEGGTAAVLSLAKNKLGDGEFGGLSKALPEMGSILGGAGSLDITSMAGLTKHLDGLGIESGVADKFAPAVMDYVEDHVGGMKAKLLRSVLTKGSGT